MKKIVSVVLFLTILISCAPMALASGETVIPLSATEKTIVGYGEGSQEATYSITDCSGSSFTFGELSQYKMYQLPYNCLLEYQVSAAASGRYNLAMYMAGFYQTGFVMEVYVDECPALTKELPPCTSTTMVDFGDINLTQGEHAIGFRLSRSEYAPGISLKAICFEKAGSLQKTALRAASYKSAAVEGTGQAIAAEYGMFGGDYTNYTNYGQSHIWTNGGAVLEYDFGLTDSGLYTLFIQTDKSSGAITVLTGTDRESATVKLSGFEVKNAAEWTEDETKTTALIKVGAVNITAGEKVYVQFTKSQQHLYYLELAHITPLTLLDEINAETDPNAVKGIFAKYSGVPAADINDTLSGMFFTGFIGAELIGKNFASLDELSAAFDAAYAKEADEPNIQLLAVSYGGISLPGVEKNSDYQIKIKKNVLKPGAAVFLARYTDDGRLNKVASGVVKANEDLTVGTVWINPGERYKIFFWESDSLKPLNIFN